MMQAESFHTGSINETKYFSDPEEDETAESKVPSLEEVEGRLE